MNGCGGTNTSTKLIPNIETMPADLLTPLGVYLKMSRPGARSFLLESVERGESVGRYSFIGADPQLNRSPPAAAAGEQYFDFLRSHFLSHSVDRTDELP